MSSRFSFPHVNSGKAMAVCAVAVALMAGPPAKAADHASAGKHAANARDPFGSYNTELNAAASEALYHLEVDTVTASSVEAARPTEPTGTRMARAKHNPRSGRERVGRLLPVIQPILRSAGVPVQLAAIVLVESGGDPTALSPKSARGLWQLMPDTAREYGLIVNAETDQRLDVVKSTRAAAEYLRDLYAEFGSWKLALAAYNAGDKAVKRAMARTGGDAFASVSSALPAETQNYVPTVLHALAWFGGAVLSPPANRVGAQQVAYALGD